MLAFYRRADELFGKAGKTRRQFCIANKIPYSTLGTYWGSNNYPPGTSSVQLADWLGIT